MSSVNTGLRISKQTTNLLTANQSSIETDTTGFTAVGSTLSKSADQAWSGSNSLKVITDNEGAGEGFYTANTTTPVSQTYTASIYLYGAGTVQISLNEREADDSDVGSTDSAVITLSTTWTRYTVSRTFGATGARARVYVLTNADQDITFYCDGLQLEQSTYPTPWHIGAGTRTPSRLTLTTDPCPATHGRGVSVVMPVASTTAVTRTVWRQGAYRLYIDGADNKAKFTNGIVTAETTALTWAVGDRVHVYGGRDGTNLIVGAKVGSAAYVEGSTAGAHVTTDALLWLGNRTIPLYFDGVDDRVDLGNDSLFVNGVQTIEMWFIGWKRTLAQRAINHRRTTGNNRVYLYLGSSANHIIAYVGDSTAKRIRDEGDWTAGIPNHIALIRDQTNAKLYGIFNGVEVSEHDIVIETETNVTLTIGASDQSPAQEPFMGKIWEFRIWSHARTVQQIKDNMFNRLVGNEAGLVKYHPIDEATGTTANNLVSGGTDGAIDGATWRSLECVDGIVYNYVHHEGAAVSIANYMAGVT